MDEILLSKEVKQNIYEGKMSTEHIMEYGTGSGNELGSNNGGTPKMSIKRSSSAMTFNKFEKNHFFTSKHKKN